MRVVSSSRNTLAQEERTEAMLELTVGCVLRSGAMAHPGTNVSQKRQSNQHSEHSLVQNLPAYSVLSISNSCVANTKTTQTRWYNEKDKAGTSTCLIKRY